VSGRGRMRKRGLSGGGTLRRKSPQQGHRPSSAMGPVASARSQWPRASHNGLMHCTVKPGRYCMRTPSVASQLCWCTIRRVRQKLPWASETELLARILPWRACGVKRIEHKGLWWGCLAQDSQNACRRMEHKIGSRSEESESKLISTPRYPTRMFCLE
jgi:hypothetical protein